MQLDTRKEQVIMEFLPFMKIFYASLIRTLLNETIRFRDLFTQSYREHYKDYDQNVMRDFSDILIATKNHALNEGKESAAYLTDENLGMIIVDLLFGIILFFAIFIFGMN